MKFQQHEV